MKLVRSIALSFAVATAAAVSVVACGGTVVEQPQTAAGVTKAPIGTNTHGFVKIVGEALGDVPLRAEQRVELEKLAQAAEARHAPMAQGRKELMLAVADQVEKGSIDKAALQPKIDKVVADIESSRNDDRAAIVKLHDTLDADQRNTFVDALEGKLKAKRDEHSPMKGFAKMHALAEELKLTDAQKAQIMSTLKDMHSEQKKEWSHGEASKREAFGHHHGKQAFEAFRGDKLDLEKVAPPIDIKEKAAKGTTHFVAAAEKILPILTPEQRKIAADKLRGMAESGENPILH
jgi:Spy/CpxP family protein refolding chaperone